MTILDDTPTNLNFLNPENFVFQLKRAPTVNFFVQDVNLPGLSLQPADVNTPAMRVPYGGDHLMYEELRVTFKIDEDLVNWLEIHDWLRALGTRGKSYAQLEDAPQFSDKAVRSDIVVTILNSARRPNIAITYRSAEPISITMPSLTTTDQDVDYVSATAEFRYVDYEIVRIAST